MTMCALQVQVFHCIVFYTVSQKRRQLIFVCNFVKNQGILMQFWLLDLTMNDTPDGMNLTHLT